MIKHQPIKLYQKQEDIPKSGHTTALRITTEEFIKELQYAERESYRELNNILELYRSASHRRVIWFFSMSG